MRAEVSADGTAVTFGGMLTTANAEACAGALRTALVRSPRVTIGFAPVERADLAFLQLLCAAHRSAAARGATMTLAGPAPAAVADLASRAGAERCAGGPPGCLLRQLRASVAGGH